MDKLEWNDSMSVGIEKIDLQHHHFMDLLNRAMDVFYGREKSENMDTIFQELIAYGKVHFETEEALFDQYQYPEADEHKKYHRMFVEKIAEFHEKSKGDWESTAVELIDFMEDWLVNHVENVDKRYSSFFISKGLK